MAFLKATRLDQSSGTRSEDVHTFIAILELENPSEIKLCESVMEVS
jgi:hypothetical protein